VADPPNLPALVPHLVLSSEARSIGASGSLTRPAIVRQLSTFDRNPLQQLATAELSVRQSPVAP